jgi:type IV secretion system protein VirB6
MADFHFYTDTFSRVSTVLDTYVSETAASAMSSFSGVVYSMLMVYLMLWGWSTLRGMINEPITDGLTRVVRLSFIAGLALNMGIYNAFIKDFLWNSPEALAAVVAGGFADGTSNVNFLDVLFGKIYEFGAGYVEKANATGGLVPDFGLLAAGWSVWIVGVVATLYGAFLLLLSKTFLALLLAVGPVFVIGLLFDGTKRFFEAWLGQALNFVFMVMLTAGVIKMLFVIISSYLDLVFSGYGGAGGADPGFEGIFPLLALCGVSVLVLMQVPAVASALGGGVAVSTLNAAGWAYGKAGGAVSAMRPTNVRRAMLHARSDVRIARNAARAVGAAPLAVYRRVTGGQGNSVKRAA